MFLWQTAGNLQLKKKHLAVVLNNLCSVLICDILTLMCFKMKGRNNKMLLMSFNIERGLKNIELQIYMKI